MEGLSVGLLALAPSLVSRRERCLDLPDGNLEEVIVVSHAGFEVTPLFHADDVGEGDAGDDLVHPGQAVEVRLPQLRLCLAEGGLEVGQAGLLRDAVDLCAILLGHLLGGGDAVLQHPDLVLNLLLLGHVLVLRVLNSGGLPALAVVPILTLKAHNSKPLKLQKNRGKSAVIVCNICLP